MDILTKFTRLFYGTKIVYVFESPQIILLFGRAISEIGKEQKPCPAKCCSWRPFRSSWHPTPNGSHEHGVGAGSMWAFWQFLHFGTLGYIVLNLHLCRSCTECVFALLSGFIGARTVFRHLSTNSSWTWTKYGFEFHWKMQSTRKLQIICMFGSEIKLRETWADECGEKDQGIWWILKNCGCYWLIRCSVLVLPNLKGIIDYLCLSKSNDHQNSILVQFLLWIFPITRCPWWYKIS